MVAVYKQLVDLRTCFERLINAVDPLSTNEKLSSDFETKIDQEITRVSAINIQQIKTDLQLIQSENAELVSKIKSLAK